MIGRSVGWLVCRSVGQSVGWSIGRLIDRSVGRSVGWLVGWLVGWSVGRLVDWLVGQRSVGRLVGRQLKQVALPCVQVRIRTIGIPLDNGDFPQSGRP